jgi:hypothetical protein
LPTAQTLRYVSISLQRVEASLTLLPIIFRSAYIHYFLSRKMFSNHELSVSRCQVARVHASSAYDGIRGSTPLVLKLGTKWR